MTEILNIIYVFGVLILFSSFPISIHNYLNLFQIKRNNFFFDYLSINFLINTILLLFLSFSRIGMDSVFNLIILLSLIFNIFQFFKIKSFSVNIINIKFIFFIFITIFIFTTLAANPSLSWDGLENWYFKAQNFYYGYNFFDLKDTLGIGYYPHLGSYLWGFFWKNSILEYEYLGRFIYVYVFLISIFSAGDLLEEPKYLQSVFVTLIIITCYDDFLFGGYQDTLIFSFLIFVSKYLYLYFKNLDDKYLILSFLFMNLLPWIKNEGYIFVLIILASLILIIKYLNKKKIFFFIFFSFLFLFIKYYIFYTYLNLNLTHGANLEFSFNFNSLLEFIKTFLIGLIVAIFKYKVWILILFAFLILFNNKSISNQDKIYFKFIKVNFFIYLFLLIFIYYDFLDEPRGLYWWIHTTLDRLLYSISGFFIILLALTVELNKNYFKK